MKKRVGILGGGKIVTSKPLKDSNYFISHLQALVSLPEVDVTCVCDPNEAARVRLKKEWGVSSVVSSEEEFWKEYYDGIVIASPSALHVEHLKKAVEKKPTFILCEKPLALEMNDLLIVQEIIRNNKEISILLNYQRHFDLMHCAVREAISNEVFGDIISFQGILSKGIIHNGSHIMDLIDMMAGAPKSILKVSTKPLGSDFNGEFLVELENGTKGTLICVPSVNYSLFELSVYFTGGKVSFSDLGRKIELFRTYPSEVYEGFQEIGQSEQLPSTLNYAFRSIYEYLLNCQAAEANQKMLKWINQNILLLNLRTNHE
jgi:predicted dehydrogenase